MEERRSDNREGGPSIHHADARHSCDVFAFSPWLATRTWFTTMYEVLVQLLWKHVCLILPSSSPTPDPNKRFPKLLKRVEWRDLFIGSQVALAGAGHGLKDGSYLCVLDVSAAETAVSFSSAHLSLHTATLRYVTLRYATLGYVSQVAFPQQAIV